MKGQGLPRDIPPLRRLLYSGIMILVVLSATAVLGEILLRLTYGSAELHRGYRWLVDTHLVEMPYADFVRRQEHIQAVRAQLGMERSRSHPVFSWIYNPTFRIDLPEEENGLYLALQIHINSHGLRGEEFPEKKPAGEIRIVTLGGSSTAGEEVREAETYPAQLQAILCAHYPGRAIRVINAGVPTYDTQSSLILYALYLYRFEPDFVTVYSGINDLLSHTAGGLEVLPKRDYSGRALTPYVWQGDATETSLMEEASLCLEPLLKRSLLLRVVHTSWKDWRGTRAAALVAPDPRGIEKFAAYYRALIRQIKASGAIPVPMTHAISYPGRFDPHDEKKVEASFRTVLPNGSAEVGRQIVDLENRSVLELGRQEGVTVSDVAAAVPPDRQHFVDFCHLRAAGNRCVAEALAQTLIPLMDQTVAPQQLGHHAAARRHTAVHHS